MLFNLIGCYSEDIFKYAQEIMIENNIVRRQNQDDLVSNMKQKFAYLCNLQTILKNLKKQTGDVSSLLFVKMRPLLSIL